jgi:signal transduction histidine kinase
MPVPPSLHELLSDHRAEVLERWTRQVVSRIDGEDLSKVELLDHMPEFLDEIVGCLRAAPHVDPMGVAQSDKGAEHGRQRLRVGFDVDEVVREYGVLADVILEVAEAAGTPLDPREVRVFQAQLSVGAAAAVAAYVERRDDEVRRQAARHRSFIAHELRTPLGTATTALTILRQRHGDAASVEVALLQRNLGKLRELIDQVLVEGRLDAGARPDCAAIDFAALVREATDESASHADSRDVRIVVGAPPTLPGVGDRRLLLSTIENLVRNGIKYSAPGSEVTVTASRHGDDVMIEVNDGCGGFEPAPGVDVFEPFVQVGEDRSGFGLGLAIAKQAAESHGGDVAFRNAAPRGCVFTLTVPADGPPGCP